ncbi:MAG: DUF4148 domain-containing protein [Burkholderiaceae bacterium]
MSIRNTIITSACAAMLAMPGMSFGNSEWHRVNGEVGDIFHPEFFKSTKTRTGVQAELDAARKDGSLWYLMRGYEVPIKSTGTGRAREEVRKDVLRMNVEQRRIELLGGP